MIVIQEENVKSQEKVIMYDIFEVGGVAKNEFKPKLLKKLP